MSEGVCSKESASALARHYGVSNDTKLNVLSREHNNRDRNLTSLLSAFAPKRPFAGLTCAPQLGYK